MFRLRRAATVTRSPGGLFKEPFTLSYAAVSGITTDLTGTELRLFDPLSSNAKGMTVLERAARIEGEIAREKPRSLRCCL